MVRCRERERERDSEREGERAARERNHRSDVENTRASRVPTWKRHRQLGSRGPFRGCALDRRGWGGRPAVSRFDSGASVRGPKPPQSATTKTPRSLFHERPTTLSIRPSVSVHTHTYALTHARAYDLSEPRRDAREKETTREGGLS